MASDDLSCEDPVTLAGLLFETAAGLRRVVGTPLERDYALPVQSLEVLIRLVRTPGGQLRMSDLAAQTSLTPSGLTRAIDRLVEAHLVDRLSCAEDRRGAFAALTAEGAERMCVAMSSHSRQLDDLFGRVLDGEERVQLAKLLRRVRDHVNPQASRVTSE